MNSVPQVSVGIDIAKARLDVYVYQTKEEFKVDNDVKGINKLIRRLSGYDVSQVVFEATGGYEYLLAKALRDHSFNHWLVDPKRIRAFIISEGIRAKTDKIDARMIALFAAQKQANYKKAPLSDENEHLVNLTNRRTDLVEMLVKEKTRLKQPGQVYCKDQIKAFIKMIEAQIKDTEAKIEKLIKGNAEWAARKTIIETVPGLGNVSSSVLIGSLSELGKLNGKQISALAGLAPYTQQSGNSKGKAAIRGGRQCVRNTLYMASLSAIRYNPKLRDFYERLRSSHKCFKVAIVAVMRKLIVILNAMLRNNESWRLA